MNLLPRMQVHVKVFNKKDQVKELNVFKVNNKDLWNNVVHRLSVTLLLTMILFGGVMIQCFVV